MKNFFILLMVVLMLAGLAFTSFAVSENGRNSNFDPAKCDNPLCGGGPVWMQ